MNEIPYRLTRVEEGGPSWKARLKEGIILHMGGVQVTKKRAGDTAGRRGKSGVGRENGRK